VIVSSGVHAVVFLWLYVGLSHLPRVDDSTLTRRFSVRVVRQDDIEYPTKRPLTVPATRSTARSAARAEAHSVSHSVADIATAVQPNPTPAPVPAPTATPAPAPAPAPATPPDLNKILAHTHTLIQPDVPPELKLEQVVPLPAIVKWSAENSPEKMIVLPPPRESTSSLAKPTIKPPNHEKVPAEIKISSTAFTSKAPALPPATTSPIVVRRFEPVTHVPETASKAIVKATPVQIVSLSDLQSKMPVVPIPVANTPNHVTTSTTVATGHADSSSNAPTGEASSKQKQPGAGQASADKGQGAGDKGLKALTTSPGAVAPNKQVASSAPASAAPGPSPANHNPGGTGPTTSNEPPSSGLGGDVTRITQPKDGVFGVVVVGSTLADQYPETVSLWSGRLIYTVYLHVGPGKSWILQYSLPREGASAAAGGTSRPDAPWPFDMVRPKLSPDDFNSDAIMVHGFVNPSGRFEHLAIVFPTEFSKSKFLLNALQQWQFRPAKENGQIAAVEVLLIIPEETE
jgi:hypothetical protein